MLKMIVKRILAMFVIVAVITFLSFALVSVAQGNAVEIKLINEGIVVTEEEIAAEKAELGLDRPFLEQYLNWVKKLLKGDLGNSYITGKPVKGTIFSSLKKTLKLSLVSFVLTVFFSISFGMLSAYFKDRPPDLIIRIVSFVLNATPTFGLAIFLLYIVCYKLRWISIVNNGDWQHLILPILTMSIAHAGHYVRLTRAAILDEVGKDYVLGAQSRGLKDSGVMFRHVLKNALSTIITHMAGLLGGIFGGTVIIEKVFQMQGMGSTVLNAISSRDIPIIQAYVIIMAISFAVANLIVDISYILLDPRVSQEKG